MTRPLCNTLVLLGFLGFSAVAHAAGAPFAAVAAIAGNDKAALAFDRALERAAHRHAQQILKNERKANRVEVERALAREGLSDAAFIPFASFADTDEDAKRALEHFAETRVKGRGMTHFGVGSVRSKGRVAMVAVFVRRLLEIPPLPPRTDRAQHRVRGVTSVPLPLSAFVTEPDGEVRSLPIKVEGRRFTVDVPFSGGRGLYTFEVLTETKRGPEVANLWTFAHRVPRERQRESNGKADPSREELARRLIALRETYGLGPLVEDSALSEAAAHHATQVCRRMVAAHILPPDGSTPVERVRKRGYAGEVTENIAIAPSLSQAVDNLLRSPGHRRNILDPVAQDFGLGTDRAKDGSACLVQVFGYGEPRGLRSQTGL